MSVTHSREIPRQPVGTFCCTFTIHPAERVFSLRPRSTENDLGYLPCGNKGLCLGCTPCASIFRPSAVQTLRVEWLGQYYPIVHNTPKREQSASQQNSKHRPFRVGPRRRLLLFSRVMHTWYRVCTMHCTKATKPVGAVEGSPKHLPAATFLWFIHIIYLLYPIVPYFSNKP